MAPAQSMPVKMMLGAAACSCWLAPSFVGTPALRSSQQAPQQQAEGVRRSESSASSVTALAALCVTSAGAASLASTRSRAAQRTSSAVVRPAYDASKEIGACDPLLLWDPIGFCTEGCTKEDFDRRRAVELKHGRICMFATIGMVWPDIFGKWDGDL
eukprot:CAMPEP_0178399966 /NCGR_PEP_ID=MMETSP0689_2-20121128/15547_1 /TAXON_ID=160604 /ORGANISM="Amphidinium massartii, Strain CS-259" /LENGTH=156 /DNA_ID=CAMNT_0020020749 /DNA_START=80 /DNA_END=547 /DNA_ORIENTATION=+